MPLLSLLLYYDSGGNTHENRAAFFRLIVKCFRSPYTLMSISAPPSCNPQMKILPWSAVGYLVWRKRVIPVGMANYLWIPTIKFEDSIMERKGLAFIKQPSSIVRPSPDVAALVEFFVHWPLSHDGRIIWTVMTSCREVGNINSEGHMDLKGALCSALSPICHMCRASSLKQRSVTMQACLGACLYVLFSLSASRY